MSVAKQWRDGRRQWRSIFVGAGVVTGVACGNLTKVTNTETLATAFDDSAGAVLRRNGAVASFAGAYARQVLQSGYLTDELSSQTNANLIDRRTIAATTSGRGYPPYAAMVGARNLALEAAFTLEQYFSRDSAQIGELFALAAAVEIMFAENLCSSVPLANVVRGRPELGPSLTRQGLVARALADLDSASHYGASTDSIRNFAAVLRGRALLDSGNVSAAGIAVQAVPVGYAYAPPFGGSTQSLQENALYNDFAQGAATVSDREGETGLDFRTATDLRVPIVNLGVLPGTVDSTYSFAPFTSVGSPIILATGVEAALIQAEAALARNDVGTWTAILNNLRATAVTPAMPALSTDSSTGANSALRLIVMFRERAFWLYLTGHRHGDLRRLVRQYGLSANAMFPVGPYPFGGTYGSDVTFVLGAADEPGNRNFTGCTDRNP